MSPQRRTGIATVMFTDVEASTDTTTRMGNEAAGRVFAAHDRIIRDQVGAHGGRVIRSTGDGFVALFDSARGGVACALGVQRRLEIDEDGLRVRIGLSAGDVEVGDGELFGAAVNLAARVMDRAHGGEVLVTDMVRQLAGTMPGARFDDRGRVALKGFSERQRLHRVRASGGRSPPVRRRSRRPIAAGAVAGVALGVALVVAALAITAGGDAVAVHANSVAVVDAATGEVVDDVAVGARPSEVAAGAGSVWVSNLGDQSVTQIGSRSHKAASTISPHIAVDGLGVGRSGVWVADNARSTARVIDLDFGSVGDSLKLGLPGIPNGFRPMAVTPGAVWIASGATGLVRLDPRTRRVKARVLLGNEPADVAVGAGAVWVSDAWDGTVTRVDPSTNEAADPILVGTSASGIAVAGGSVWVTVPYEDRVKRIDLDSNAVSDAVPVSGEPAAIAFGAGSLWVTTRSGGTLVRIDPATARVQETITLGNSPQGVAVVGGDVWVAVQARARARSVAPDVVTALRPQRVFTSDPTLTFGTDSVLYATCAMLFNYPDRPFPAGLELQPEVASAMPAVSADGRTYTFRLREGFRFSPPSGAPVTAAAFRRAIERGLHPKIGSYAAVTLRDVAGLADYRAGRTKHLAGVTARGNTLTIRLRAPSATLPARLASTYFCAVPPTTPISAGGTERIPMAGPYYIASLVRKRELVLKRNPNYGGSRPARLREIDFDLTVSPAEAVDRVQSGRADYTATVPAQAVEPLERRYGAHSAAARKGRQRFFSGPVPALHMFLFNVDRPLFASTHMRQAANAALDRPALAVRVHSGYATLPGRPTDQFIPPDTPGFRDARVYSLRPDVERARRLAGLHGRRRAVLLTCNEPSCVDQANVLRRNLAAIGIDVDIQSFSVSVMFDRQARPDWDITYMNWFHDFMDSSQFVNTLFGDPPGLPGGFHDAGLFHRMRAATRLPDAARADAFAQLDEDFSRAAVAAPFATAASTDFFADRIGCQVHQPVYGISLGALCVR